MYVADFRSAVKVSPVEMIKMVIDNKENVVPDYIDAMYSGAEFSDSIEQVDKKLWEQLWGWLMWQNIMGFSLMRML